MARQSFFIETPASRIANQFEFIFGFVHKHASSAADRANLLKAIRAPQPKQPSHQPAAQLELSLTQPEPEPIAANASPAPVVAKKQRAQETKPRKRASSKLIQAVGTREHEVSAIVSREEWDAHMEQAQMSIHTTGKRAPIPETPYRPSVAQDKDAKPHVSLSSGVGVIFDAEIWSSMDDDDATIDPLPSRMSCRGIMPDGGFGCSNPKLPGHAYCKAHHSLYCAKTTMQRDRLDAAARQRQVQLIAPEDVRLARSKVRASNSNAGKGWKNLSNIRRMSSENRLAAAE